MGFGLRHGDAVQATAIRACHADDARFFMQQILRRSEKLSQIGPIHPRQRGVKSLEDMRVSPVDVEVFAVFGRDNQQPTLPLRQRVPGNAFQPIDGDQQRRRADRFDQLHRLLHNHLRQSRNAGMTNRSFIRLNTRFRQQQCVDRSRVFRIDQLLSELGQLEQFGETSQHFDVRLLQLSTDDQQHNQFDALAARNAVIDPRSTSSQHHAEVTLPIDKGMRQGKIAGNERLCRRFTLFDRFQNCFRSDSLIFPVGGLYERSNGGRTLLDGQLHDPNRTYQIAKIQWPVSSRLSGGVVGYAKKTWIRLIVQAR